MVFPMDRQARKAPVTVEYDSRGSRVRKTLSDPFSARRFYSAKLKAGKNPVIITDDLPPAKHLGS